MRVAVVGAGGQLGKAVSHKFSQGSEVVSLPRKSLNIADEDMVCSVLMDIDPDLVVNCAAYTAVDRAEEECDLAYQVNADGPRFLANAAAKSNARLIHISTDFVFSGQSSMPYVEEAEPQPLSVYGKSKLQGEQAALEVAPERTIIVRSSWVYSNVGKNFVKTMLEVFARTNEVRVVSDQAGTPTSTYSLARAIEQFSQHETLSGLFHWSDSGIASWYDFAVAIAEEAYALKLLKSPPQIVPITTAQYPTPAMRPAYSVLNCKKARDTLGLIPDHWRVSLRHVLQKMV